MLQNLKFIHVKHVCRDVVVTLTVIHVVVQGLNRALQKIKSNCADELLQVSFFTWFSGKY